MARVLPSAVVGIVDGVYGEYIRAIQGGQSVGPLGSQDAHTIAAVLSMVDQIPPELFSTLPSKRYIELLAGVGALRAAVEAWARQGTGYHLHDVRMLGNPLYLMYCSLKECKDEAASVTTAELAFIDDVELRDSLRLDITEVERGIAEGRWKSATVVGGSVIEALLLWALGKCEAHRREAAITAAFPEKAPTPDLNKWTLQQLVAVAKEARLIAPETQGQCDLTRDFRNLIHPGRTARLGQRCDQGTALAAAAAVAFATRDLEAELPVER